MRGGMVAWVAAGALLASCARTTEQSSVPAESSPPIVSEPVSSPVPTESPTSPTTASTSPPVPEVPPTPAESAPKPPDVAPTRPAESQPLAILRPDGLGRYDFGAPANDLVAELELLLGPPTEDASYAPPTANGRILLEPFEHWEQRVVAWNEPELRLVFDDIGFVDGEWTHTPGSFTLVSWTTSSPQLAFANGLGVGYPLADLRAHHPKIGLGTTDVCESGYHPAGFSDTPPLWRGLRGTTDWDWVSDLQVALNEQGAGLVVDGIYGPKTRDAVTRFQEANWPSANGLIDPETADALELQAPEDARIAHLEAGYPGTC